MELFGRAGDGNAVYLGTRQRARLVASLVDLVEFSGNDHGWRYCCLLLSLVDLAGCRRQILMKKGHIKHFCARDQFFSGICCRTSFELPSEVSTPSIKKLPMWTDACHIL